jgi:nicotinamide-nucleotide amidase
MKNDEKIIKKIITTLSQQKKTLSFAESCTGGRIAAAFTSVAGASSVLNGSVVSYSNEIKTQWLHVDPEIFTLHGAVSQECVSQMLDGIQKLANADYAIAVSGIAGPEGGSLKKPVGTVYIGLLTPKTKEVVHCFFEGNRREIQEKATHFSINKLKDFLKI